MNIAMKEVRILFSARDAAAAYFAAPIARLASLMAGVTAVVVAQEPALNILRRENIDVEGLALPPVGSRTEPEAKALLREAQKLLDRFEPDAVIVGLSSRGQGGIDEALLLVARCPTFLLQDFWGEFNDFFGRRPGQFLVLDAIAKEMTEYRHKTAGHVIGSPRHSKYAGISLQDTRQQGRERIGIEGGAIGWFGQALHHRKGYQETVHDWMSAVSELKERPAIIYKPHPRESKADREMTMDILSGSQQKVHFLEGWPIESALLACDCVCSIMSNCLYDAAYLNFFSGTPLVTPVSFVSSPHLVEELDEDIVFDQLPYSRFDLAMVIRSSDGLVDKLAFALSQEGREQAWRSARRSLSSPERAASKALQHVVEVASCPKDGDPL